MGRVVSLRESVAQSFATLLGKEHLDPCYADVSVSGRYQSTRSSSFVDHARSPGF